jgi:hypothetical protein
MAFSLSFPKDFVQALSNTLTDQEVNSFLKSPDCSPRFVYGALMLPTILKYNIDLNQNVNIVKFMTQATLSGYQLYEYADESIPIINASTDPNAVVQGMLIFNLNSDQRNSIHELEGGLQRLASVQVEICQKSHQDGELSMRKIDAGTFEWDPKWCSWTDSPRFGLRLIPGSMWDVESFLRSELCRHMVESQRRRALTDSNVANELKTSDDPGEQPQSGLALSTESSFAVERSRDSLEEIDFLPSDESDDYFSPVEDLSMLVTVEDELYM